jgi:hypothetical protein
MKDNHIVDLIVSLLNTNSPKERKIIILEQLDRYNFDKSSKQALLEYLNIHIEKKHNQGIAAVQQRKNRPKKKEYLVPAFYYDNNRPFTCNTCKEVSQSNNIFVLGRGKDRLCWHALPICFPTEFKKLMQNNERYKKSLVRSEYM